MWRTNTVVVPVEIPLARLHDLRNVIRDLVGSLAFRVDLECFAVDSHRGTLAIPRLSAIMAKFRFAPACERSIVDQRMQADLERILFEEATIHRRLDELAAQITNDYRDRELTVIAILNGSVILMADLLRRIPLPLKLDCLSIASYHGGTKSFGELVFRQVSLPDIAGRHVLILDDILDSGVTLATIREKLEATGPLTVRICVLLAKKRERVRAVQPDYVGFEIADEFVVGYGLDYMERYRNLPCIGVLRKELIAATS